jgi:hypothetical protein
MEDFTSGTKMNDMTDAGRDGGDPENHDRTLLIGLPST